MDLVNAMRVFHAVADSGSFTAATERLQLSRGMATKYVNWLERHLGTRLLQRTTRRLALTEAGRDYLARVAVILAQIDEAEAAASQTSVEPAGRLRINAPLAFGVRHLGSLLAEFRQRYPQVTVELELTDRRIDMLEEGVDLALRISDAPADSTLVARPLAPIRVVVCAAPGYLATHGTPATPEGLARHECLLYTLSQPADRWTFGPERVVTVQGGLSANNGDVLLDAARQGLGIIRQPTFLVGDDLASGRLIEILADYPLPPLQLYALYPHRQHLPRKVRVLVEFLEAAFAAAPP
ncbi:LysR family transcriptional regulator [Neisseriaceae bacterium JH1-16]|nr:LysR family transcriptional regulator [Neisseriaceae bacterium JH1-16]